MRKLFHWMNKLFGWAKKLFSTRSEALSPYQEAVLLLKGGKLKDPSVYRDFSTVVVHAKTLHDYTVLITKAINTIERRENYAGVGEPFRVTMAEFFMGPGGMYVPVSVTQRIFIDSAIELIQLYERLDTSEDLNAHQINALSRVYPVVRNLCDLSVRFNEDQ